MKQKMPYAIRLADETRAALEAAAIGGNTRPRTLAARLIAEGLRRRGYMPRSPRQVAPGIQAQ